MAHSFILDTSLTKVLSESQFAFHPSVYNYFFFFSASRSFSGSRERTSNSSPKNTSKVSSLSIEQRNLYTSTLYDFPAFDNDNESVAPGVSDDRDDHSRRRKSPAERNIMDVSMAKKKTKQSSEVKPPNLHQRNS
jgi:hypothetical protein